MTPDPDDYRHLVERRTPEFDREAMAPDDENRVASWAGAAFCTAVGLCIIGVAVVVAVKSGAKAWGWS